MLVLTPVLSTSAVRILVDGLIDYAGLFPPASQALGTAIHHYARYRGGNQGWMLGRFVVPVTQLEAFAREAEPLLPRDAHSVPWRLTAIGSGDLRTDLNAIASFNERHQWSVEDRSAVVDGFETRVSSPDDIARLVTAVHSDGARSWGADRPLSVHAEMPIVADPAPLIALLAAPAFHAKVRAGGLTAEAFPARADLLRFLEACVRYGVPFKATAGLHHAWRGTYPLTYETGCASASMYGFLNLLLTTALLSDGVSADEAAPMLEHTAGDQIMIDEDGIVALGHRLTRVRLAAVRERLLLAVGSCSFTEPVAELRALGWL
jgi:hypothetical protein